MNIDLFGKTAIVTGASRGIGKKIKSVLEECGAKVYDFSRTSEYEVDIKYEERIQNVYV